MRIRGIVLLVGLGLSLTLPAHGELGDQRQLYVCSAAGSVHFETPYPDPKSQSEWTVSGQGTCKDRLRGRTYSAEFFGTGWSARHECVEGNAGLVSEFHIFVDGLLTDTTSGEQIPFNNLWFGPLYDEVSVLLAGYPLFWAATPYPVVSVFGVSSPVRVGTKVTAYGEPLRSYGAFSTRQLMRCAPFGSDDAQFRWTFWSGQNIF